MIFAAEGESKNRTHGSKDDQKRRPAIACERFGDFPRLLMHYLPLAAETQLVRC